MKSVRVIIASPSSAVSEVINMCQLAYRLVFLLIAFYPASVSTLQAQEQLTDGQTYIQVSSHPTLQEAIDRASMFAPAFPQTTVFATSSGWFAVVIGVMDRIQAPVVISGLVAQSMVPNDTLSTVGKGYIQRVWPQTVRMPDRLMDQARRDEQGWNQSVRQGVQNALVWSGDYNSKIDGVFGDSTRRAIQAFQAKTGGIATGYLTRPEIETLEQIRKNMVDAIGYKVIRDMQSGVVVGFPTKFFNVETFESNKSLFFKFIPPGKPVTGGRVILISHAFRNDGLQAIADIVYGLDFVPASAYRVNKDDWFVVSGESVDTGTYAYARRFGDEVKGFVLVWPESENSIYKPLAVAMYNSLESIPETTFEYYLSTLPPGIVGGETSQVGSSEQLEAEEQGGGSSGTGFFVNQNGFLLTNEHVVAGCTSFTDGAGAKLELIAADKGRDLAILRDVSRNVSEPFATFSAAPIKLNADVTAVGFPLPGIIAGLNVTRGSVSGVSGLFGGADGVQITAPVQSGNSGGPLLDEFGLVVGVVQSKLDALVAAEIVGDLPQNVNFAIRGETAKTAGTCRNFRQHKLIRHFCGRKGDCRSCLRFS